MTRAPRLADVVAALDALYDPSWAQSWDAVGLVVGDPEAEVRRVLLAVDPVEAVINEAASMGVDLLVTHHPLLLRPVHSIATDRPKGRAVTSLVRSEVALYVAHTNADSANPGVSDALARVLELEVSGPLRPEPGQGLDKIVTFVPVVDAPRVIDALAAAGAGRIGNYERAAWTSDGVGTFTPMPGARPAVGSVGTPEEVAEKRVEMVLPRRNRAAVVAALKNSHPYEEPAFDIFETVPPPGERGIGRVGELAHPEPLHRFAARVAARLPATPVGVRISGDPDAPIRRVAVCGGAGDDLFEEVRRSEVDAYVTADLRHHPASEAAAHGRPALVDCSHWASEWPWLLDAQQRLEEALAAMGTTVETRVSQLITDPWTSTSVSARASSTTSGA